MKIVVRDSINAEDLRKHPESISRFGLVAKEINEILSRYGYTMLSAVPPGSLDIDMVYMDVVSQDIYELPSAYPMELQIALQEVNSLSVEIENNRVINTDFKSLDMEEAYRYETFGWSEELLSMWRLASRAANISLKQIRIAIASVEGVHGAAFIQVIKSAATDPKFEVIPLRSIEDFMSACSDLDDLDVDVINVVINKPIPKTKSIIPITYAVNPSKYIGMSMRG